MKGMMIERNNACSFYMSSHFGFNSIAFYFFLKLILDFLSYVVILGAEHSSAED